MYISFRFFLIFCLLNMSLYASPLAETNEEKAFFAICSLRHFIECQNDPDDNEIFFSEQEILRLWELASASEHPDVSLAKEKYLLASVLPSEDEQYKALLEESSLLLLNAWESLHRLLLSEIDSDAETDSEASPLTHYPNFDDNPLINETLRARARPHLLPLGHIIKPYADSVFSNGRPTQTEQTLAEAGFIVLFAQPYSFVKVCKHPLIHGFVLKIYLDNETRIKEAMRGWEWLCRRCEGVQSIRMLIKRKKITHFTVPHKYLYPLPYIPTEYIPGLPRQKFVLLATDMQLVSAAESINAWKTKVTKKVLDELYYIVSHGFGSCYLPYNVPYSKKGKFAFIDTEYPKRDLTIKYKKVNKFLSPEMSDYWNKLIRSAGKSIK